MEFPLNLTVQVNSHNGVFSRNVVLRRGTTVLLGPNGSGKTHLLRAIKGALGQYLAGKKVHLLSAGRMGLLEQYRSDYDGQRGSTPRYDEAIFGSKRDSTRRHEMETLNGDFQTLAVRADILVKIQERLRKLFRRDVIVDWDGGNLKVLFSRLNTQDKPYSSGREASGLMHLVGILSALYDDEIGALLIDEPEVSLHPQLQAFLLKEIEGVAGKPSKVGNRKLIILATHSTEMLQIYSPSDLLSLVFCYDLGEDPIQISPDSGELNNKKVQGLVARLGQEHKLSLFSKRPLIVEGPSDVLICGALADKLNLYLEAAGSQLLPVTGKGQVPTVAKLLRLMGKAPVALVDADGVADGLELATGYLNDVPDADVEASASGFASAHEMASSIYSDFCQLVDTRWADIADTAQDHPYWTERGAEEEGLAKRRAVFSSLFALGDTELRNLSRDEVWLRMRARLTSLLDLLEKCGLFVLRRGTIESYYQSMDRVTSIGKPAAAVEEIEGINQRVVEEVVETYSDVVRCIRYAANSETICEADALRDLLLAVVTPAHARFRTGDRSTNFNVLARSILGERSQMISLDVVDDKLQVSIKSAILDVRGFPIQLSPHDNVEERINNALAKTA